AELQGARNERLRRPEVALSQRQHRVVAADLPELSRLSQLVGDVTRDVEISLRTVHVYHHHLREVSQHVSGYGSLGVSTKHGDVTELGSDRKHLGDRVRSEDGVCASVEGVGERSRVFRPPGELDRLAA